MTHAVIDSAGFPHIVDNVLQYLCTSSPLAALNLQTVSKSWHTQICTRLFSHLRLTFIPPTWDAFRQLNLAAWVPPQIPGGAYTVVAKPGSAVAIHLTALHSKHKDEVLHPGIAAAFRCARVLDIDPMVPDSVRLLFSNATADALQATRFGPDGMAVRCEPVMQASRVVVVDMRSVTGTTYVVPTSRGPCPPTVDHLVGHLWDSEMFAFMQFFISPLLAGSPRALTFFCRKLPAPDTSRVWDTRPEWIAEATQCVVERFHGVEVVIVNAPAPANDVKAGHPPDGDNDDRDNFGPVWHELRRQLAARPDLDVRYMTREEYRGHVGESAYRIHAFQDPM